MCEFDTFDYRFCILGVFSKRCVGFICLRSICVCICCVSREVCVDLIRLIIVLCGFDVLGDGFVCVLYLCEAVYNDLMCL